MSFVVIISQSEQNYQTNSINTTATLEGKKKILSAVNTFFTSSSSFAREVRQLMTRSTNVTPSPVLPASPTTSERSDVYPKCPVENQQYEPSSTPPPSSTTELSESGTNTTANCGGEARRPSTPYRTPKTVVLEDGDEKPCCSHNFHKDTNKHEGQPDKQQDPNFDDDKAQGKAKTDSNDKVECDMQNEGCQCEQDDCVHHQQTNEDDDNNDEEPETDLDKDVPFTYCPDCHHFDDKDMGRIAATTIEEVGKSTDSPSQPPGSATPTTDEMFFSSKMSRKKSKKLHEGDDDLACSPSGRPYLSKARMREFREAFRLFDKDGDGCITKEELGTVMRSLGQFARMEELKEMLEEIDVDGDGNVSFDEFVEILSKMVDEEKSGINPSEQEERELRDAFRIFDKHNRGYITASDLRAVLQCLGENMGEDEIEDMIKEVDVDGDGRIDFYEFVRALGEPEESQDCEDDDESTSPSQTPKSTFSSNSQE